MVVLVLVGAVWRNGMGHMGGGGGDQACRLKAVEDGDRVTVTSSPPPTHISTLRPSHTYKGSRPALC